MASISGNVLGNQNSFITPYGQSPYASTAGNATLSGSFGVGQGYVNGTGTVQMGPMGMSSSVPWADGFSATPANTVNGLGLASPFASTQESLQNIGPNSFGQQNPYTPLFGTPYDLNNGLVMATGAFGGYQNPMSIYSNSGLPQSILPDGSMGYGGRGGTQPGNFLDSNLFGGAGVAAGASPMSVPMGGGVPLGVAAATGGDPFGNPGLFAPVGGGTVPGMAQSFSQTAGDLTNKFNLISDGFAKLFMQGEADPNMARTAYSSGGVMRTAYGTYQTSVGWAGGNANAGLMGSQASGMSWAMTKNPIHDGMIVSYANPYYNHYNFNQGFINA